MHDRGTLKYSDNARMTASFALPSVGEVVVCTRIVPSVSTVMEFTRARGITRILKICFEFGITH